MTRKGQWFSAKLTRVFGSFPTIDLIYSLLVVAAVITIAATLIGGRNMTPENNATVLYIFWTAVVIGVFLILVIIIKTWLEYRRKTYDPALIFQFQKEFDLLEEKGSRLQAAKACMAFLNMPKASRNWETLSSKDHEKVERLLDFFEDVGFYLNGDQFSDEVTHHHFFHWIRGWYSNLDSYIDYYRNTRNQQAAYENIHVLYDRVSRIEKKYEKPILWLSTDEEKLEFLKEEYGDSELGVANSP